MFIEIKRGLKANLPSSGRLAEPFFCTDTGEMFVWNGSQMVQVGATGGSVASVFGRTGAVAAQSGDYSSFYDALGVSATETTRAQTAEGLLVAKTVTVNGHAMSANVVVSASDLTTGTLPHAQLPALLSGDIPANAANTSGTASNLSGTPSLPNGTTATTQLSSDNTTKLATTAYVKSQAGASGPMYQTVTALSAAQITNLAATSVQLVAAPGSGFLIYPLSVQLLVLPGSTKFAGGISSNPFVLWGTGVSANILDDPDCDGFMGLVPTVRQLDLFKKDDVQTVSLGNNQPLSIACLGSPNAGGSILTSHVNPSSRGTGYAPGDTGQLNDGALEVYTVTTVNGGGGVTGYTLSAADIQLDGFNVGQVEGTQASTGNGDGNFQIVVDTITQGNGTAKVITTYLVLPTS